MTVFARLVTLLSAVLIASSAQAGPFHVLFESDTDLPPGDDELAIVTYPTIADIVTNSSTSTLFTDLGVASGFTTTGIAFDGSLFHVLFESDTDLPAGADELAIVSYPTVADIVSNSSTSTLFTDLGVATGFTTTGFAFDGSAFHVLFESDTDLPAGADELAIITYPTIADIVSNSSTSTVFTDLGVAAGFTTTGLVFVPDPGNGPTVPEPGTLGLIGFAVAGLAAFRRSRQVR